MKHFTFQGKRELPEYPQFNASHHLAKFGEGVKAFQQYSDVRGGWVSVSPNFFFSVKDGKPVVLRRDGVTQIPSFDEDWERANRSTAPTNCTSVFSSGCLSAQENE